MSRLAQASQAVKEQLKARVAITGPAGGGKTLTALQWAQELCDDAPILLVDSERRSASLYADRFTFDTIDWLPPYDPDELAGTIRDAGDTYGVIVVDSVSHWWEGEGGVIDIADNAGRGNSFAGWKTATPKLRDLIETIIASPAHVIVTMRSKTEYVVERDEHGKSVPRKIGLAPVMRHGVEYEFTLIADMSVPDNVMTVSKSRCDLLSGRSVPPAKIPDAAVEFLGWLNDGEPKASPVQIAEVTDALNAVDDKKQRAALKKAFVAEFTMPATLTAAQVQPALDWIAAQFMNAAPVEAAV